MNVSVPLTEVTDDVATAPTVEEVKTRIVQEVKEIVAWVLVCQSLTFSWRSKRSCCPKSWQGLLRKVGGMNLTSSKGVCHPGIQCPEGALPLDMGRGCPDCLIIT